MSSVTVLLTASASEMYLAPSAPSKLTSVGKRSLYSTASRTHKRLGHSAHPRLAQPHTHTHTYTLPVHLHPQRRFCSLFSHCRSTLSRRRFPLICSHASLAILLLILLTLPITNTFLHLCLSSPSHKSHTFDHPSLPTNPLICSCSCDLNHLVASPRYWPCLEFELDAVACRGLEHFFGGIVEVVVLDAVSGGGGKGEKVS